MIKNRQTKKVIAIFLLLNFLTTIIPVNSLYANNNGPNAPEASGFEPVSATDMVNLSSGDMAYVLPLLEIDGFPVTLSYHAGIPMDMEASWVGLGWNINTGAIARGVVSTPDDWNKGRSMKLIYYKFSQTEYTVNVGVGFGKAASVGVGLSWGSNKSLSGSVSASIGPISASMDTNGNYGVGINSSEITKSMGFDGVFDSSGSGDSSSPFGGSLSISGNTSGGGLSGSANAGYSKDGLNAGLGISVSGNGIGGGYSIGGGNGKSGGDKVSSGQGGSIGSFSAGDMNIESSGFFIPISIGIFSFGFGFQEHDITYQKGLNRYGFGVLYQSNYDMYSTTHGELNDNTPYGSHQYDHVFNDLQRRNYYGDIYDQELPQSEIDFISNYKTPIDKINFTFAGYDSYEINASGINGSLKPILGQNTVLIGEGHEGDDTEVQNKKMKAFYHNSKYANSSNSLRTQKSLQNKNLHFTFSGQVNNNVDISGAVYDNSGNKTSGLNLSDFVTRTKNYSNYNGRPITGSFVEVYTNKQLDDQRNLMLYPNSVYKSSSKNRIDLGYMSDGIGGYKITSPDGKTYHFAQPVYQYEKIEHNYVNIPDGKNQSRLNSSSKRSATPYATHWLLTAITGPDFIDVNNNNYPDKDDFGYWLRLDHGQWSNAYTWRTPYANSNNSINRNDNSIYVPKQYRSYSTTNKNDIDIVDAGHFMQGRKDLYYLDKIVSRNQVAYFVKDLRKDGLGTDLNYNFNLGGNANTTFKDEEITAGANAIYDAEYLLRLDKIVITKNEGEVNHIKEDSGNFFSEASDVSKSNRYMVYKSVFQKHLPPYTQTHRLHQSKNIIDINDFANFDYSKALKTIKLDNNHYELAKESPNSLASTEGRLTLKQVKFYGRGMHTNASENELYDYMPPYKFDYKTGYRVDSNNNQSEVVFQRNDTPDAPGDEKKFNVKDSWGFIEGEDINGNTLADTWSLNKITTPQGSTIEIEYKEDDFHVEAFSRRFWGDKLKFKVVKTADYPVDEFEVHIRYDDGFAYTTKDYFTNYFDSNDRVFLDLWYCVTYNDSNTSCDKRGKIDIVPRENGLEIKSLTNDEVILKVKGNEINDCRGCTPGGDRGCCNPNTALTYYGLSGGFWEVIDEAAWFAKRKITYRDYKSNYISSINRGSCPPHQDERGHSMKYKLLATKSPRGNSGGGLKVSKITVNSEAGEKYETEYDYSNPNTGKSSGITSFYPVYGTKYVPYQNELPGPGVMYEWVTMQAKAYDVSGNMLPSEYTRYHYYTLQPNFHIFDPNIIMKDNDDEVLFKATVRDKAINKANIKAKDIHIEKNLSKVGQLISIEQFNSKNQLLNKTVNHYKSKANSFKETFTSMKSIYNYDINDKIFTNRRLKDRLLSLSSVSETAKILNKVTTITPYGKSSIEYSNIDPWLGNYRTSKKIRPDGTVASETKYPAYQFYPEMRSKIITPSNKNMLTQEAMNITRVNNEVTNASVTTWKNNWVYRDTYGNESSPTSFSEKIWRKHKNYVWKGDLNTRGAYDYNVASSSFNWQNPESQSRAEWQQVSEITRYTHFSLPIETRDINGNHASSKMADNWSKTIAGGNASYKEMYYSGIEYPEIVNGKITKTEDEFSFENCELVNDTHTGENALKMLASSKAFNLTGKVGNDESDRFKPQKYKVSFWKYWEYYPRNSTASKGGTYGIQLKVDNEVQTVVNEETAGHWRLVNYIIDLSKPELLGKTISVHLSVDNLGYKDYVDDFRMHPVHSSMNSYVYDKETDELKYILDANNLATEYRYDKAGRLCKVFKEVVNSTSYNSGFKLVKEYKYRYKNAPASSSNNCNCCD